MGGGRREARMASSGGGGGLLREAGDARLAIDSLDLNSLGSINSLIN